MTTSKSQSCWKEISRLVLNPRSKDIKLETYSSFVLDTLFEAKKSVFLKPEDIVDAIARKFKLKGISPSIVEDSLEYLASIKHVLKEDNKYTLTEECRKEMQGEREEVHKTYEEMLNSFVNEVQTIFGSKLDEYQKYFVKKAFEKTLFEIFENLGQTTVNYVEGINRKTDTLFIQQSIVQNANAMKEPMVENAEKIKSVLPEAVERIFTNPTEVFSKGLLMCAIKHVMWRILGVDPELRRFRAELFKDTKVLLDTNILIASLCGGSARHKQTRWILETTQSVGVTLLVSDYTITEFANAVNYAEYLHERPTGKEISARVLENEITRTYYTSKAGYTDWATYITMMKHGAKIFVEEWNATVIKSSDYNIDPEHIEVLKGIIRSFEGVDLKEKPEILIEHDAINILLVQAIRDKLKNAPFSSPWFVTHHRHLKKADNAMRMKYNYGQVSCISCDAWFELIYPFVWADVDELEAATVFTNIVATNVLPLQTHSAISFVGYIATELQLPVEDEDIIKRIIEESHLRRVLEEDLERGDMNVALATFVEIIGGKIEAERKIMEKDDVILRLVKKIQSLQRTDTEIKIDFEVATFKSHLNKIETAITNDEKKKTLENFADYFVSMFHGWKVIGRDIRTEAEEIDLIVRNNIPFLKWGDPILVECKNWSRPVGKNEIVVFLDKLKLQGCSTGLLIAKNGITGTERSDAGLRVREALGTHGIRIIVLSIDDLNGINTKEQLEDIITKRYYNPTEHLR